ncbi:MAG: hypothetical protein WCI18_10920 [Pseudomonadota bacterium]
MKKLTLNLCAGVSILLLQACDNYTTQPLCDAGNATTIPGIEGTYTVSIQGPAHDIATTDVKIEANPQDLSHLKMRRFDQKKSLVEESDATLCHINGRNILQTKSEDGMGFSYVALIHSAESLTYQPVAFDRVTLDVLGIGWKVQPMPEQESLRFGGQKLQNSEDVREAFVVSNDGVALQEVWKSARIMPVGLSLLKK